MQIYIEVQIHMFRDDKYLELFKYWRKYKPEEELYLRIKDNPVWPFKALGDGYYYVSYRSDRVEYGIGILIVSIIILALLIGILGFFSIAVAGMSLVITFGIWALHGKMAWRELLLSKRGKGMYMERVFQNEEMLLRSEIRNVYIRLARKVDSLGDHYFYLVLGGYLIDDHRISRMTRAQSALRTMGMRVAYRVGINFFDWKDESEDHLIWHYKSFTKLTNHKRSSSSPEESEDEDYNAPSTLGKDKDTVKRRNVVRRFSNK